VKTPQHETSREEGNHPGRHYEDAIHFISHELKNSVSIIGGFTRRVIKSEEDPHKLKQLKVILDQTRFLETVSSRFLFPSPWEDGRLEVHKEEISRKK
jgi:signal transduction histidine kinase